MKMLIYGHGGQLGHVIPLKISFSDLIWLHVKFGFSRPNGFRGDA